MVRVRSWVGGLFAVVVSLGASPGASPVRAQDAAVLASPVTSAATADTEAEADAEVLDPRSDAAQGFGEPGNIHFDIGFGTAFPVHVGAQLTLELPYRLQLQAEVGYMPREYLDAVNEFCVAVGCYDDLEAELISAAFGDALVLRGGLGWRPLPAEGFEFGAGYTAALLGGGLSRAEAVEAATDTTFDRRTTQEIPLRATMHGFQITLGWRVVLHRWLVLRTQLAYFHVVASDTWIDLDPDRNGMVVDQASRLLDDYLEYYVTTYFHTAVLTLTLNFRAI